MNIKPTVSILGTLPPIRALSSYCFELAHAIAEKFPVEFISFKKIYPSFLYPGGAPDDDTSYPPVSTSRIHEKRHLTWYNPLSWFIEGISAKGALLHAQWWSMPLFPIYLIICFCFKAKKRPVIFTVHNVLSHEKSNLYFRLSQILFKLGDFFIVHSAVNREQMHTFYKISLDRISVIPHGSLDFHVRQNVNKKALRKEMGVDQNARVILLFGAIRPYKGIDTAIRAFAEVIRQIPDARLFIAGRAWEDWQPYARLINDLEVQKYVITALDYIPSGNVYKYFEISDLCLFPYHHFDSQSGAGSAALSFRKPMIVANVGGLPDLVKDPQWVVPPGNATDLAEAMIRCLENPDLLERMKSDINTIAAQFSWSAIADKTTEVYKKALNKQFL